MSPPNIKPMELKEDTCKQGHYEDIVPKLHMTKHAGCSIGGGEDRAFN